MSTSAIPQLNATDRCDRCGAQAYVRANLVSGAGILLFCAHHGREYLPKLKDIANIWDESDVLELQESSS